jgi:hypothetical protein
MMPFSYDSHYDSHLQLIFQLNRLNLDVSTFLDNNKFCEDRINELLKQMFSDANMKQEGDIRYFINEFAKTGALAANANTTPPGGGYFTAHGSEWYGAPPFPELGWGFIVNYRTDPDGYNDNMVTFIGELIHAIGKRSVDDRRFNDDDASVAMEKLGWAKSLEEFQKDYLAMYPNSPVYDGDPVLLKGRGSLLWHPVLEYLCYDYKSSPVGLKITRGMMIPQ